MLCCLRKGRREAREDGTKRFLIEVRDGGSCTNSPMQIVIKINLRSYRQILQCRRGEVLVVSGGRSLIFNQEMDMVIIIFFMAAFVKLATFALIEGQTEGSIFRRQVSGMAMGRRNKSNKTKIDNI